MALHLGENVSTERDKALATPCSRNSCKPEKMCIFC